MLKSHVPVRLCINITGLFLRLINISDTASGVYYMYELYLLYVQWGEDTDH